MQTFCPHLTRFFLFVSSFTTFRPNFTSGHLQVILPRPRIGRLSLVTVSPVITAFHSCCLSHHVFDQVNLWPAWVGFETAIFWQCSPGTVETQRPYPLRPGPRRAIKDGFFFWSYKSLSGLPESGPDRIFFVLVLNHFFFLCDRQQLWKVVITGDTVTRLLSEVAVKSPEEGQRWNLAET